MTTIDSKELYEILAETPAEQNIMLAGNHGIVKTQILTKYFEVWLDRFAASNMPIDTFCKMNHIKKQIILQTVKDIQKTSD